MAIEDEIAVLRRAPIFRDVDPARLRLIAISADRVHFKAGERIYTEGEPSEDVLFILSGEVRTERGLELQTVVGYVGTLLKRPRAVTAYAVTDVEALCLGREEFLGLLKSCGQISLAIIHELARVIDKTAHPGENRERL